MTVEDSELEKKLERLKHLYGLEYEMIRATATFEHAALRPLFILNGGALVVYLGLFGALRRGEGMSNAIVDLSVGRFAVLAWVAALILATLAAMLGALSQFAFRKARGQDIVQAEIELGLHVGSTSDAAQASGHYTGRAVCSRQIAIVLGILSIVLFMAGFWPAFQSIK